MSYDSNDAAWDEAYERISRELYPEHREQAIVEYTDERLRSFYLARPDILIPAVGNYRQAKSLLASSHTAAALVFAASSIELFLKEGLLRPVVFGLVHSPSLAQLVVDSSMAQTGFKRYSKLLAGLYRVLTFTELESVARVGAKSSLLAEASVIQERRNQVLHQGATISAAESSEAVAIAGEVFNRILVPVLEELSLSIEKSGHVNSAA